MLYIYIIYSFTIPKIPVLLKCNIILKLFPYLNNESLALKLKFISSCPTGNFLLHVQ